MRKVNLFFVLAAALLVVLTAYALGNVSAVDTGGLSGTVESIEKVASAGEKIQDIGELRADFLLAQWKELFLKNPYIGAFDAGMRKSNLFFVIVFSRSYDFSIDMFFVLMLWLTFFLSLSNYMSSVPFLEKGWQKSLAAVAVTILFAHIQIYNFISTGIVKALFYPNKWYWNLLIFVSILAAFIVFFYINKMVAKHFAELKKAKEASEAKFRAEKTEATLKEASKGDGSYEKFFGKGF